MFRSRAPRLAHRPDDGPEAGVGTKGRRSHRVGSAPGFWDNHGWGFGLSVVTRRDDLYGVPGRFGWDRGYGTSGYSDPKEDVVTILMTQRMMESPTAPPVFQDFWTSAYQAIAD